MIRPEAFEALTTSKGGIAKLRQLILDLAVRGLLMLQDPKDEPAIELLKKISIEKQKLNIKEKNVNTFDCIFEYYFPKSWCLTNWENIALKIGDIDHKMPSSVNEGYPYVSPRDFLPNNKIDFKNAKKISKDDFLRLSSKIQPQKGDLIYPRYGTIGENRLVEENIDFLASYSCCVIKTVRQFVEPKYQYYFSISDLCKSQAKIAENKTTQANVGIKSIQQFIFPLPPLEEQKRIVAKVDDLMAFIGKIEKSQAHIIKVHQALLDTLLANLVEAQDNQAFQAIWTQIVSNFDMLLGSTADVEKIERIVLDLAVMGKLGTHDVNDEPASVLIEKINLEKQKLVKDGTIKKQPVLPEIVDNEKPFEVTNNWKWTRLLNVSGYIQRGKSPVYSENGTIKVISQKCVQWSGFDLSKSRFIDNDAVDQYQEERFLKKGDLIWNSTGTGTVGRVNAIDFDISMVVADTHVTIIRPLLVSSKFLNCYLSSTFVQSRIEPEHESSLISGSTKQKELNLSTVNYLAIPLPPLEEQKRIVAKVDDLMKQCALIKEKIGHIEKTQTYLANAIVEKAVA